MMDTTGAGVALDRVTFQYPAAASPALRDLTLEARPGEITWLLGELGAGCTTALLVMAGLAPRLTDGNRDGTVSVLGLDPADGRGELAGRIGLVTASPQLQLSGIATTVADEVAFTPANLGWPAGRIEPAVQGALEALGIASLARRHPGSLSGGELQRVILASVLALAPAVWLLDDPAPPLDAPGRELLAHLLQSEKHRGATIVIAGEDADFLLGLATRVVVLRQGSVVLEGDPARILAGTEVWDAGAGSTTIAGVVREAHMLAPAEIAPPFPITLDQVRARWSR
ncbi:MAG: energy-coupling factor ABC transporter ATP-binding protein [Gemmatimonadales bacterium]